MSKAEETKLKIIQQAANLFNQQGYAGSSMSDIMKATGLKKGGIYNHFVSKDELAIAAFDFAVEQVSQRYVRALKGKRGAIASLKAIVHTFCTAADELPLKGGCPLLNTAVESDDAHPALRERTQQAMYRWRHLVHQVVQRGVDGSEIQPAVNPDEVATVLIAVMEGALMLTKLYGDRIHLQRAEAHLNGYIESLKLDQDLIG
ncbi:MAG: TetR/AcrR family transcriptional regulator [Synechococcales bacterium]|nr:TetR/AcrR family transcriptional regulator [Synechococcales bacterium]